MKHTLKITLILIALFLGAQFIGLFITNKYINYELTAETGKLSWKSLPSIAGIGIERPEVKASQAIFIIIGALVLGTLFILLIMKFDWIRLWKCWFFFAITFCLAIAFAAFVSDSIAFLFAVIFAFLKVFRPNFILHNFTELFVYGGLAVLFVPILNIFFAIILLLLLSVYDMYAVWKSKHMIRMAKFQTKSHIFAGLLIPYRLSAMKTKARKKQGLVKMQSAVLGGGDIGFPLIFAGTVLQSFGFVYSLIIPVFAGISLCCLLMLASKRKFYPALPFLTAGCLIGLGVVYLVNFFF